MENTHIRSDWETVVHESAMKASAKSGYGASNLLDRQNSSSKSLGLLSSDTAVMNLLSDLRDQVRIRRQQLEDIHDCLQRCHLFLAKATQFYRSRKYQRALQAVSDAICNVPERHCQHAMMCSSSSSSSSSVGHHNNRRSATDKHGSALNNCQREQLNTLRKKLVTCYSLRAHILFKYRYFKLAQNDATQAVLLGASPQHLVALKYFIGYYHSVEGSMEEAVDCFSSCLKVYQGGNVELPKPLEGAVTRSLVESAHDKALHCVTLPFQTEISQSVETVLPKLEKNKYIAHGSNLMAVKQSREKGRFLEARDKIKAGDPLIVERPYASVLLTEYHDSNCYHCLKPVMAPVPCNTCCDVRFCSVECRNESISKYHDKECLIWPLIQCVGPLAHLALRILLRTDPQTVIEVVSTSDEAAQSYDTMPGFVGEKYAGDYRSVFHLVTNAVQQPPEALLSASMTASLMAMFIKNGKPLKTQPSNNNINSLAAAFASLSNRGENGSKSGSSPGSIPRTNSEKSFEELLQEHNGRASDATNLHRSASFCSLSTADQNQGICALEQDLLAELILHHLQQLACNVHSITRLVSIEMNEEDDVEQEAMMDGDRSSSPIVRKDTKRVALAVYPTASLLNHACDPDVIVSFVGDVMVVRATHNIAPGEEITHCYGPHVGHMMRTARQKLLKKKYFFTCLCGACKSDQAKERKQLCQLAIKCQYCEATSKVSISEEELFVGTCQDPSCQLTFDVSEQLDLFLQSQEMFADAVETIKRGNVKKSIGMLKDVLKRREALLAAHDRSLAEVHDALAKCFAVLGDWVLASYHCTLSTDSVERLYGKSSPELALELLKLAQFLFRGRFVQKCIAVAERGIKLLSMHYGRGCPAVTELMRIRHSLVRQLSASVSQFSI